MKITTISVIILALGGCAGTHRAVAQSAGLSPSPKFQPLDNAGKIVPNGRVYTFAAGTSTPQASFVDSGGVTTNTNPIVLDAAGRANLWLGGGLAYKIQLQTSAGATIWTVDNVSAGPLDMMTTDTAQTVTASKNFTASQTFGAITVSSCTGCGGGGGSSAFSAITSGTNTTATMTLGSGSMLVTGGTAVINFGTAGATTPARKGTAAAITGSTCGTGEMGFATDATAGQNIYLCTATNTWTQVAGGGSAGAFGSITGGTNTSAAMVVGSGASLAVTGSGTIKATSVVDSAGLSVLLAGATSSAVNQVTATNAATGSGPSLAASGTDTNIALTLKGKGTGVTFVGSGSAFFDNAGNLTVTSCSGCGGGGGSTLPVVDSTSIVKGNSDATKQMRIDVSTLVSTSSTRVATMPDYNLTLAGYDVAQTFTQNQTYAANILASGVRNVGGTAGYFDQGLFKVQVEAQRHRMIKGDPSAVADFFDLGANQSNLHNLDLKNSSGQLLSNVDDTRNAGAPTLFYWAGHMKPLADNTYDLGDNSGPLRWGNLYLGGSVNALSAFITGGESLGAGAFVNNGTTISRYQSVTTHGYGVAPIYSATSLTGQTTQGSSTNIFVGGGTPPAGQYRVSLAAYCTGFTGTVTFFIDAITGSGNLGNKTSSLNCGGSGFADITYSAYTDGTSALGCNGLCWGTNSGGTPFSSTTYSVYITAERLQ